MAIHFYEEVEEFCLCNVENVIGLSELLHLLTKQHFIVLCKSFT